METAMKTNMKTNENHNEKCNKNHHILGLAFPLQSMKDQDQSE